MQRLVPTNKLINFQNVLLKCSKQNLRTSSVTNANRLLINNESNQNRNLVTNSSR
jgi:hypothetical protein